MVTAGDAEQIKVIDFGLARTESSPGQSSTLTSTGGVLGSPAYMSPEQCRGEQVDVRSDIYSLGCVIYEMLCDHLHSPGQAASS